MPVAKLDSVVQTIAEVELGEQNRAWGLASARILASLLSENEGCPALGEFLEELGASALAGSLEPYASR